MITQFNNIFVTCCSFEFERLATLARFIPLSISLLSVVLCLVLLTEVSLYSDIRYFAYIIGPPRPLPRILPLPVSTLFKLVISSHNVSRIFSFSSSMYHSKEKYGLFPLRIVSLDLLTYSAGCSRYFSQAP